MKPIAETFWCLLLATMFALVLCALINENILIRVLNVKEITKIKADPLAVILYAFGSMTGSFDENFFKFGKSGNIIVMLCLLFSHFFIIVYYSNLRAFIIGREFEWIEEDFKDIDFLQTYKHVLVTTGANSLIEGKPHELIAWKSKLPKILPCQLILKNGEVIINSKTYFSDKVNSRFVPYLFVRPKNYVSFRCMMESVVQRKLLAIMTRAEYYDFSRYLIQLKQNGDIDNLLLRMAMTNLGDIYSSLAIKRQQPWENEVAHGLQRLAVTINKALCLTLVSNYVIQASGIPHLFTFKPLFAAMLQENPYNKGYSEDSEQVAQGDLLELFKLTFTLWGVATLCFLCELIKKCKFKLRGKLMRRTLIRPFLNLYIRATLITFLLFFCIVFYMANWVTEAPFQSGFLLTTQKIHS